jgi:glycosyltransferase involved in cell wall biosynthesis
MISGAEACRIRRAIESVRGWTSEVVVVLNHEAADGTEEICRNLGVKVWREPWKGHIAQKNSAAAKASSPWILGLDCDEAVSPELRLEIERLFTQPLSCRAYSFPRLSWYCGRWIRHGDWYPDRQTRLWQRGRARWGGVDPHDRLIVEGRVGRLRGNLLHYTAESINKHISKLIGFSDEFVRQHQTAGRRLRWTDLAFRPFWRFFRAYVLRLGFLDGWPGYYLAWHCAFSAATRYAKVHESRLSGASLHREDDVIPLPFAQQDVLPE